MAALSILPNWLAKIILIHDPSKFTSCDILLNVMDTVKNLIVGLSLHKLTYVTREQL